MGSIKNIITGLLLSGGMDSISILYWKKPSVALTINYGQNSAKKEIEVSRYVCKKLNIDHHVINIDCSILSSGDLSTKSPHSLAPNTDWWPFRNQLLLTFASMYLIKLNVQKILIGSVKSDMQFKDGTTKFTDLISTLTSYQEGGIVIESPAINLTTNQLITISNIPLSLLLSAHSCHKGNIPCGICRGCNKYIAITDQFDKIDGIY